MRGLSLLRGFRLAGTLPRNRLPWKALLAGAALFVLGLVVGFVSLFPVDFVAQRALAPLGRQLGLPLAFAEARKTFPPGVELRQLTLGPAPGWKAPLTISRLTLRPWYGEILSGQPGLRFDAELLDGSANGRVSASGKIDVAFSGLRPGLVPILPEGLELAGALQGRLSGIWEGSGRGEGLVLEAAWIQAGASGLERFGTPFTRLDLGQVETRGTVQGRRLQLENMQVNGQDLEGRGDGSLLLGDRPETSRLALNLSLQPRGAHANDLRDLLMLTGVSPDREGRFALRLGGTLAVPSLR